CSMIIDPPIDSSVPPFFFSYCSLPPRALHSFPTRRSSDLAAYPWAPRLRSIEHPCPRGSPVRHWSLPECNRKRKSRSGTPRSTRSEEHTSELQSHLNLVCRLLLEKKKKKRNTDNIRQNTRL